MGSATFVTWQDGAAAVDGQQAHFGGTGSSAFDMLIDSYAIDGAGGEWRGMLCLFVVFCIVLCLLSCLQRVRDCDVTE